MEDGLKNGGFVGGSVKMSQLNGAWFAMGGYRLAWVINEHFTFGAAYYDLLKQATHFDLYVPPEAQPPGAKRHLIQTNYAGMELGYIGSPEKIIFFSVYTLLGLGHLQYVEPDFLTATRDDRFVFAEPSVDVNLNLSSKIKFAASVGYRLVSGIKATGMSDQDMTGPTYTASIIIGSF